MRQLIFSLFFILFFNTLSYAVPTTWYVRSDGGTSTQCDGTHDSPYLGSGTGQPCAVNSLYWILLHHATNENDTHGTLLVAGGDTILIGNPVGIPNQFEMGYDATTGNTWSSCSAGSLHNNGCFIDGIPAGPDSLHPTRLLGRNYNSCTHSNITQLYGYGGVKYVLYEEYSNIDIECLDITDHYYGGAGGVNDCNNIISPVASATNGIGFNGASNVTLKHVWVHGVCANNIQTQFISGTYNSDYLDSMGGPNGGWNQAFQNSPNNTANETFTHHRIEWNGCAEAYPLNNTVIQDDPSNFTYCGFGNGNGVGYASGNGDTGTITMSNGSLSWNQDSGIDNLHSAGIAAVTLSRMKMEGNGGQAVKLNASPGVVENSLLIGNCGFMNGQSFNSGNMQPCRANDTIALAMSNPSDTYRFYGNTILSNNDVIFDMSTGGYVCTSVNTVKLENNIILAGTDFYNTGTTPGLFTNCQVGSGVFTEDYDQIFNTRNGAGDVTGAHSRYGSPLLVGQTTLKMTTSPYYQGTSGSTLVGLNTSSPSRFANSGANSADESVTLSIFGSNDYYNVSRGANWDGGALQYQSCSANTQWCGLNGDCCGGSCTENTCGGGVCTPNGSACGVPGDCCSGNCCSGVCSSSSCQVCTPLGNACSINSDCCSTFCCSGFCLASSCGGGGVAGADFQMVGQCSTVGKVGF